MSRKSSRARRPGRHQQRSAVSRGEPTRHSGDVHSGGQYTDRTNSAVKGTVCALLYTLLMLSWYITSVNFDINFETRKTFIREIRPHSHNPALLRDYMIVDGSLRPAYILTLSCIRPTSQ